jgi:hypothetical protein
MRRRLHHPDVVPRTPNEDEANRYPALQKKIPPPPPRHRGLARRRQRRRRWEEGVCRARVGRVREEARDYGLEDILS